MRKWILENNINISKEQYLAVAQKFGLTKRELELGFMKVSGFSNRRIAYMLGISEQTVKNHFTHIYEKAWVPGRKEFIELFVRSTPTNKFTN
jgi:DNA-binding CsgD family transcriptional regulator